MPIDMLDSASRVSLILASCWAIRMESSSVACVSCLHRLNTVVLPETPPYVSLSLSHLSLKVGRSVLDAIREYTSGLMYRRRYALTLLWIDSHSIVGTFVCADLNLSRSSALWSVRITSMIPDQFAQSDPSNCSSLILVGILKVDVYALLTRSLFPADPEMDPAEALATNQELVAVLVGGIWGAADMV